MLLRLHPEQARLKPLLEEHLKHVVVPIIYDHGDDGIDQKGSGTLVEHGKDLYLLTALHTFEGLVADQIKIPPSPEGGYEFISLTPRAEDIFTSDSKDDDIILIRLNGEIARRARAGWHVVQSSIGRNPSAYHAEPEAKQFLITGYPSCLVKTRGDLRGGVLVTSYVELMESTPEVRLEPINPDSDVFFFYSKEGVLTDRTSTSTPHLGGVSGAAIWEMAFPEEMSVWTPAGALRLVAIQSSADHSAFARGKRWAVIAEVFAKTLPPLPE